MSWYNLKVGNFNIKITPLNPIEKEYPSCDKDGKLLKKVSGKFEKGHFINEETGEKYDTAFKLINNKPYSKLSKTKEVNTFKEVDKSEVGDLLIERQYLVENDTLLQELTEKGKALKFGFTNGNGFKVYKGYLYPSEVYKNYMILALGTTQISEIIKDIDEVRSQAKKLESIELTLMGVDKAKVEDLINLD